MAQRSSAGLLGSRIGSLSRSTIHGLTSTQPDDLSSFPFRPLESTAGVEAILAHRPLQPEEFPAIPAGARDGFGNGGERGIARALPREAILQGHHLVSFFFPRADQLGAGLDARFKRRGIEGALAGSSRNLAQPLLRRLRQPAERLHLHL